MSIMAYWEVVFEEGLDDQQRQEIVRKLDKDYDLCPRFNKHANKVELMSTDTKAIQKAQELSGIKEIKYLYFD